MYIPYGKQEITEEDIEAVIETLKSDFLTQGPKVPEFESRISKYCDSSYASAFNSATSALHGACMALGLKEGDEVWTSPISFVASANCALYCGAKVDFVDIDENSFNMSTVKLEEKLEAAKKNNKLPKIVIPVHLAGTSCDMKKIHELSLKYNFNIIEDASHAIGGKYKDSKIGKCEYSDICIFSFHPVKIITSGEGGVATTNSIDIYNKMNSFRTHGIVKDELLMTKKPDGPWYYEQIHLGYNYRLTDIQASLGISQLKKLDRYVSARNNIAKNYNEYFKDIACINSQLIPDNVYSAFHLYIIRIDTSQIKKSHKDVFVGLRDQGIGVNIHYIPIHLQTYYKNIGFNKGDFEESEKYYKQAISLPMFPTMSEKNQDKVIESLIRLLK